MQIKKAIKKGFTLVELVVVIAVIAILAATSVGVYFGMVESANRSADQQAVVQMNKVLVMENILDKVDNILDVHKVFEKNGLSTKSYTALAKDHTFYYDTDYNKILYVNTANNLTVEYPEEHENETWGSRSSDGSQWFSLNLSIKETEPTGSNFVETNNSIQANVATPEEFAYVMRKAENLGTTAGFDIDINLTASTYDFMGADISISYINSKTGNISIKGPDNGKAVFKNIASTSYSQVLSPDGKTTYGSGLIGYVSAGHVTVENITFENCHIDGTVKSTGGCGMVAGFIHNNAVVKVNNVTIKDSTIAGNRSTGAVIGQLYYITDRNASRTEQHSITNVSLENTKVYTDGGRSALVVGLINSYIYSSLNNHSDFVAHFNKDYNFEDISIDAYTALLPYNNEKVYSYDELPAGATCEYFFNGSKETTKYLFNDPRNSYYGFDSNALVIYQYADGTVSEYRTINSVNDLNNAF